LTLHIDSTAYAVRPIPCDREAASLLFRLRKSDGTTYYVAATPQGPDCDCPAFTWHGRDRNGCKHIKALVAVGLLHRPGPDPHSPRRQP
jgi:hypothetical protein